MNILFYNTRNIRLKEDISKYDTVKIEKAYLPFTYYNVKRSLNTGNLRYAIIDDSNEIVSSANIVIPEGLYTLENFNDIIQIKLKEIDFDNAVEFVYLNNQGRIEVKINSERFVPYFQKELCEFLGLDCADEYIRNTKIGNLPPKLARHLEF